MLEASTGQIITDDLPQTRILAEFAILGEGADEITFDFNHGLSEIQAVTDWVVGDVDDSARTHSPATAKLSLKFNHIENAYFGTRNNLVIIQRAVGISTDSRKENLPIELHYYLSPYQANPEYKTASNSHPGFGFFETNALMRLHGGVDAYATRIDPRPEKKFVYAISANTPAEYRDAIREGVLYWNSAFGDEKISVIDAPTGVSAPNPDYNLIQWMSDDTAESSVADAQIDPRTGEILHAQIYLTSAFALLGRDAAYSLGRKKTTPHTDLTIAGLMPSRLCEKPSEKSGEIYNDHSGLSRLNHEAALEVSRDYIRASVAHEVGHTLGLRHNFAASLGASASIARIYELMDEYVKTLSAPTTEIFTDSVMDYNPMPTDLLVGRQIHLGVGAFHYDRAAIRNLYFDEKPSASPLLAFCTDQHLGDFFGCLSFDQGPSSLESSKFESQRALTETPERLLELILNEKSSPLLSKNKPPSEIVLDSAVEAAKILAPRMLLLRTLTKNSLEIRVANALGPISSLNIEEAHLRSRQYLSAEIERLGGLTKLLPPISTSLAQDWLARFNELIESPAFRSYIGADSKQHDLSDEDVRQAKALAHSFFASLQNQLYLADLRQLKSHLNTLSDSKESDTFAEVLRDRALDYILKTSVQIQPVETIYFQNKTKRATTIPKYYYRDDVRAAAAKVFQDRRTEGRDWGMNEKQEVVSAIDDAIALVIGKKNKPDEIDTVKSPRGAARWAIQILELRAAVENAGEAPADKNVDAELANDENDSSDD